MTANTANASITTPPSGEELQISFPYFSIIFGFEIFLLIV